MGTSIFMNLPTKCLLKVILATNSVFQVLANIPFFLTKVLFMHKIGQENYCGFTSKKEVGWEKGERRKHRWGGYFMAIHCTTAVARISQMCYVPQSNGGLWENMNGWAHLRIMTGKTTNWKHMVYWFQIGIIFSMKIPVMGLEIIIWIASLQL